MAHLNEIFLRKRASEILLDKLENATIFDEEKEKQIPVFSASGKYISYYFNNTSAY